MRHFVLVYGLLLPLLSFAQEEIKYKEYSYSEFFQLIEDEEDSIFELSNALIIPNPETDKEFEVNYDQDGFKPVSNVKREINKRLNLKNIYFKGFLNRNFSAAIINVTFNKSVRISSCKNLFLANNTFNAGFEFYNFSDFNQVYDDLLEVDNSRTLFLSENIFNSQFAINSYSNGREIGYYLLKNTFILSQKNNNRMLFNGRGDVALINNIFKGDGHIIELFNSTQTEITRNTFDLDVLTLDLNTSLSSNLALKHNEILGTTFLGTRILSSEEAVIDWHQFGNKLFELSTLELWRESIVNSKDHPLKNQRLGFFPDSLEMQLFKNEIINVTDVYKSEIGALGKYYQFYKNQHDTEFSNAAYVRLKDLETERLAYLYNENPNFKSFFTWKINQFLKVFSAYGTEPARAIIFSVYVILAFALVYLFFPNYWDSHGKNRIMDRYRFFTKYMKRDSGMHEVYLEEKNPELMASEDFKSYMQESEKGIPKFFMATALPLYRWSVSGTKTFSWMLSKVDVLKGKWSDTEDSKKGGKSILLIGAFLIALLYDIFIKILNALMLSINTFTTLGFGEIPIKGLPRYLAIIQGFIGWFMLTIFSVSLISQLLN